MASWYNIHPPTTIIGVSIHHDILYFRATLENQNFTTNSVNVKFSKSGDASEMDNYKN